MSVNWRYISIALKTTDFGEEKSADLRYCPVTTMLWPALKSKRGCSS
jgi:hypothetical protein